MPRKKDGSLPVRLGVQETIYVNDLLRRHIKKLEATTVDGRNLHAYDEGCDDAVIATKAAAHFARPINRDHVASLRRKLFGPLIGDKQTAPPEKQRLARQDTAIRLLQMEVEWLSTSLRTIASSLGVELAKHPFVTDWEDHKEELRRKGLLPTLAGD